MLAMLALSGGGERTRSWLQDRLWGSRMADQGKASLRRELSNLRAVVNIDGGTLLHADHQRVWIDLAVADIDARTKQSGDVTEAADLLEGFDIAGEEGFEDWLRTERARMAASADNRSAAPLPGITANAPVLPVAAESFAQFPALAVFPFANETADPAFDHIAEGMSEDLLDRMASLRWLPVIARSSSFAVVTNESVRDAALRLGARYAIEGRLRAAQDQLVLAVGLIDADTGTLLWSSRSELPVANAGDFTDEMIVGLAAALGAQIDQQQQAVAASKQGGNPSVRDLLWRGKWHLHRLTRDDAVAARDCFTRALALEPTLAEAIIQVAWVRLWDLWVGRANDADAREGRKLAQRAVIADCEDARGYMLIGIAESWLRQPLRAEAMLERAIALNPSLVMARVQLGATQYLRGNPALAIGHLSLALRLSPNDQYLFFTHGELAQAHLMLEDYDAALNHADRALLHRAGYWMPYVIRINALVKLDRLAEAKASLADLRAMRPDFTEDFCDWTPFVDPRWNQFLKHGLNLASG